MEDDGAALRTMQEITSTWVEDGYPNYQVWWFKLRADDRRPRSWCALGLIETIGIWRSYKLTREGQYWALQHRERSAWTASAGGEAGWRRAAKPPRRRD